VGYSHIIHKFFAIFLQTMEHTSRARCVSIAANRGYRPEQLVEQMIVSVWCGAARFAQADITGLDAPTGAIV